MPTLGQQIAIEQQRQQMSSSQPSRKQQQMFKTYTAQTNQENARRQIVYDEALKKISTMSYDEYKNYYATLEPWLKQSFKSPQSIEQERKTSIQKDNARVDEKIKKYNDTIAENRKNIEDNRIWFNSLSGKTKQSLLKSYQDKEDRYNRKIQEAQEYINQLNSTRQYVQQGASFDDVFTYVSDVVSNVTAGEEAQRQAQKKSEQAYQKLLQTPFASVYTKAKTEYGDLDWTNPKVSETLLQENWINTYGVDAYLTMKTAGLTRQVFSERGKLVTQYLDPTGQVKAIKKQDKSGQFTFQVVGEGLPQTFKQSSIEYKSPVPSKDIAGFIVQSGNQEGKLTGNKKAIGGGGAGGRGNNKGMFSNVFDFIDNLTTRKFGLITSYSAYGVPVQSIVKKSNPSFPPQQGQTNVQVDKPNFYEFVMNKYFGRSKEIPIDPSLNVAQKTYTDMTRTVESVPTEKPEPLKTMMVTGGLTTYIPQEATITKPSGERITYTKTAPDKIVQTKTYVTPKFEPSTSKLYYNPSTQEVTYFKKSDISNIPADYMPVEKLAMRVPTKEELEMNPNAKGTLVPLKSTDVVPEGYVRLSTQTLEPVYGEAGLTKQQYYEQVVIPSYEKASFGEKIAISTYPKLTKADPFGLKSIGIYGKEMLYDISKGKYGYSEEESIKKVQDTFAEAFTKYSFESTGEKQKPLFQKRKEDWLPSGFYFESPVAQTTFLAGGGIIGGSVLKSMGAGIGDISATYFPKLTTGVKALPLAYPTAFAKLSKVAVYGSEVLTTAPTVLTAYKGYKEGLPFEDILAQSGTSAIQTASLVGGIQTGMKYPMGGYGKITSSRLLYSKDIPEKLKPLVPKELITDIKPETLWRGIYIEPLTLAKTPTAYPIFGRTISPTTTGGKEIITGFGMPKRGLAFAQEELIKTGYVPSTRLESRFFEQYATLRGQPTETGLMKEALFIKSKTAGTQEPKGQGDWNRFRNVKTVTEGVNEQGQKEMWKWVKSQKGDYYMYGSGSVEARIGKKFTRVPNDLDITFNQASGKTKAEEMLKILQKTGNKARIVGESQIEVLTKEKGWQKLWDIHGYDTPQQVPQTIWGYEWETPTRISQIPTMTLSQSQTQKLGAVLTGREQPSQVFKILRGREIPIPYEQTANLPFKVPSQFYFSPEAYTSAKFTADLKHIPDFYEISKYQTERLPIWKKLLYGKALSTSLGKYQQYAVEKFGADIWKGRTGGELIAFQTSPIPSGVSKTYSASTLLASSPSVSFVSVTPSKIISAEKLLTSAKTKPELVNKLLSKMSKPSYSPKPSKSFASVSVSTSPSPSFSSLVSKVSKSVSTSPSFSPSVSPSISVSVSPSPSPRSPSPSPSPSPSVSVSPSPSPSPSPSTSPSSSPSPLPTYTPYIPWDIFGGGGGGERPVKKATKEKLGYTPDFTARVLGAVAKLTPKEYEVLPYKVQTGLEIRPLIQIGSSNNLGIRTKLRTKTPKGMKGFELQRQRPIKSQSQKSSFKNNNLNKKLKQLLTI